MIKLKVAEIARPTLNSEYVWVAVGDINLIRDFQGGSIVLVNGFSYQVEEKPETVMAMIEGKGFEL